MAKYAKWFGGTLGWALGGPVGAIIGFGLGALVDEAQVTVYSGKERVAPTIRVNDFTASLLVLSAAVMKSDGKALKSELDFIKNFFTRQFGEEKAYQSMLMLREILKREIPLQEVCVQIRNSMPHASRLQLIHYLFGLSKADGSLHPSEIYTIEQISHYLGISSADMNSIKAMYYSDDESDYKILEINKNVSDDEIKKAYRKMALKFHPDKVAQEGADVQRAANEKFKKLQSAYENIKKTRGIN